MPILDLSSLKDRLLSSIVLIPFIVLVIYLGGSFFAVFLAAVAMLVLYEFWQMAKKMPQSFIVMAAGCVYICAGFGLCYQMRDEFGFMLTGMFFLTMWLSDTGAYFFGKLIGGPKMAGAMSPNKTWAGYCGALLVPIMVVFVASLDPVFSILMGAALGMTGQAGDLLMSLLKRHAQVKDSGSLIPGHGGVLDRVDSLLPAVPVFMAFARYGDLL
jgi:phosphatidate cytidylyltransferase